MHGIEVRESGAGTLIELWGEFDVFSLSRLRQTLNGIARLQRPILVDLSGITFLDLLSARELAVRSQLCSHYLAFGNPSPEVEASARAFGLQSWVRFRSENDRRAPPVISEVF